ncbi:MAG: GYD domain-containing protein [Alphaproteobacteria bacterium]
MNTYIALMNLTEQGIKTIHESGARSERGKALMKKIGGRIKDYYLTLGGYDFVVVFEAPNDEAMARFLLEVGRWGAVRSTTLKAFSRPQAKKIIGSLSRAGTGAPVRRRPRRGRR